MLSLNINGRTHQIDADPETPLLWVIREWVGLTGTKYGCGIAQCGACSVHIDGQVMRSCSVQAGAVGDAKIVTIEGLSPDGLSHPVQKAWLALEVAQCGYCQSGQIMAAAALLAEKPPSPPTPTSDAAMTNICRCGTYQRVRAAIHTAAAGNGIGARPWQRSIAAASSWPPPPRAPSFWAGNVPGGALKAAASKPQPAANTPAGKPVGIWVVDPARTTPSTIRIARSEMGQGTLTGLAQLVADELEADWNQGPRRIRPARGQPRQQARLGRHVHRRQPRHPHLRGLRPPGRCRRPHHAGPGRRRNAGAVPADRLPSPVQQRRHPCPNQQPHPALRRTGRGRLPACPCRPTSKLKDPSEWKHDRQAGETRLDTAEKLNGSAMYLRHRRAAA